jgi:hypothetical protein
MVTFRGATVICRMANLDYKEQLARSLAGVGKAS